MEIITFYIVINDSIAMYYLNLHIGLEYGCNMKIVSTHNKTLNMEIVLLTYICKDIHIYINGNKLDTDKITNDIDSSTTNKFVFKSLINITNKVDNILVCSNNDNDLVEKYYPYIFLDFDNNIYNVIDKKYSHAYVEYPMINNSDDNDEY
ncbi:hypothetical protein Murmansk-020 [Murmansk poxvirus]|uniref:Uncharacterized protein n=1 Tax=Murmansk poxvirus TaxID=2025359 RepID=A0A223FMK3_9POXV|nr:hypothetical protein CKM52_gp020 [Murmansk poxvirus]AST09215.1 hypothetical protein Murmansk-020 [Murmansk poxvirus]